MDPAGRLALIPHEISQVEEEKKKGKSHYGE